MNMCVCARAHAYVNMYNCVCMCALARECVCVRTCMRVCGRGGGWMGECGHVDDRQAEVFVHSC